MMVLQFAGMPKTILYNQLLKPVHLFILVSFPITNPQFPTPYANCFQSQNGFPWVCRIRLSAMAGNNRQVLKKPEVNRLFPNNR